MSRWQLWTNLHHSTVCLEARPRTPRTPRTPWPVRRPSPGAVMLDPFLRTWLTFDGAKIAVCVLANPHALRIVAVGPVRRRAAGADPFVAALVATLLLLEALPQGREQLLEAAHGPATNRSRPG